ncbi:hypothetical protein SEA_HEXBUG_62 [Gordonia phage Hexbug]|nr:hypothetical protein SEA_ORLA_64 [Gordonia phage Orla]UVK62976.1 hypothetical protein SEA_HEXBUG_62 [Gordonia phage Hexbug]WNN96153.1 hypothetical protein SEA_NODIGI_62 [Gordonia phage Nodigi]
MTSTPITLRDLLRDDAYRQYFKRAPRPHLSSSPQWAIVGVGANGKYGKIYRPTFGEAFAKGRDLLQRDDIVDISIFCRNRVTVVPDVAAELMRPHEDWCGRCRRPSVFRRYGRSHPALRDAPVIVEGMRRCYFCGISLEYVRSTIAA